MTWTSPPTVATGDIYTAAMFNTYTRDNMNHLRTLTGGADPGGANKALYSTGASTGTWGLLPSDAMLEQKVNQVNPIYTTFAAASDKGSGMFIIENNSPSVADGPVAGVVNWHLIQSRYYNFSLDFRVQLAFGVSNTPVSYIRWIVAGSPSAWYKLWHQGNDGPSSDLNADLLDDRGSGNATTEIPINNGTLNIGLHADILDGFHAGNGSGQLAINNGSGNTNLNADMVDNFHAGNASGQVPINNGTVNAGLNADMVDGIHAASFARVDVASNFAVRPTFGSDQIPVIANGQYSGNNGASRQITCGFIPKVVLISGYESASAIGIKAFIWSTTPGNNVKDRLFPSTHALRGADSTPCDTTALHSTDGFIVDNAGSDSTNTSGFVYNWVAFG